MNEVNPGTPAEPARPGDAPRQADPQPGETRYLGDTVEHREPPRAGGTPPPAEPGYPAEGPAYSGGPRGAGAEYPDDGAGYSGETLYLRDAPGGAVAAGEPGRGGGAGVPGPATEPGFPAAGAAYADKPPYSGEPSRPAADPAFGDGPREPGYSSGETLFLGDTVAAPQGEPKPSGGSGPATEPGFPAVGSGYAGGSPYPVGVPGATGDSGRTGDDPYPGDAYSGGGYADGAYPTQAYPRDAAYSGDAYSGDAYSGGHYIGDYAAGPAYAGTGPAPEQPAPSGETGQAAAPAVPFTIVERPEMLVVGYAVRTSPAIEADPSRAQLPALWRRAGAPGAFAHVPARVDENLYAVLTDYESDHRGAYTQVVGIAVHTAARLPEGMVAVRVPGVPVMKLEARGPMPQALIDAWQQVWKHTESGASPARAFTTDLEVHHPDGADLYIAILPPPSS